MPLFDFQCKNCGATQEDVFLRDSDEPVKCTMCDTQMEKMPSGFSFTMTPGAISKHKKQFGNKVPPEYKTSGGANIYGVPRKS